MSGDPWTPGPWTAVHRSSGAGPNDDEQSGLGWEVEGPPEPFLRGQFARAADARLIAAAPEMAALLARVANEHDMSTTPEIYALLARIQGEAE